MAKICPNMSCPSVHRSIELIWLCEGELLRSCKRYANAVGQPACYVKLVSGTLPALLSLCLEVLPFETEIIGWWSGPQLDQQSLSSIVPLQIHGNKGTSIGAQSSTAGHGGSPLSGCENIQRATPIRSLLAQPPICHAAFGLISSVGDCLSFEDHTFLESGWI